MSRNRGDVVPSMITPKRLFQLQGRVALVTGATGHLGTSMSSVLAAAGATVIVNARGRAAAMQLAGALRKQGHQAIAMPFDVTIESSVRRALAKIEKEFGRLDVVVNNAYAGGAGTIANAKAADFSRAYRISVEAAFRIVQLAHPLLKRAAVKSRSSASVINIASMYGVVSPDPGVYGSSGANNPPFYGPAKAALIQLTRYLACHLAVDRIRVNAISPGPFPSDAVAARSPEFIAELSRRVPLGRVGHPVEIAGPLLFLASDASSYVTGSNLAVDGGWTAW
ncbi:MAG: SDR family oxidoreductase [Betaproteobacteria bacterium]|jgi:NAD(P)-dependent dehydrogenase (short-subunit alcohol dehydrogenase family)